jgi:hypothetical protein
MGAGQASHRINAYNIEQPKSFIVACIFPKGSRLHTVEMHTMSKMQGTKNTFTSFHMAMKCFGLKTLSLRIDPLKFSIEV